jgi:hypothetical protein
MRPVLRGGVDAPSNDPLVDGAPGDDASAVELAPLGAAALSAGMRSHLIDYVTDLTASHRSSPIED